MLLCKFVKKIAIRISDDSEMWFFEKMTFRENNNSQKCLFVKMSIRTNGNWLKCRFGQIIITDNLVQCHFVVRTSGLGDISLKWQIGQMHSDKTSVLWNDIWGLIMRFANF